VARPLAITPEIAARIDAERAPGLTVRALHARLAAVGVHVALATLHRHMKRPAVPGPGYAGSDLAAALRRRPKPSAAEAPAPPDLAADDDLGRLARRRDEVDQALGAWQPQLGANGAAVRAYRALSAELASLTRTLVELRPRPEVEAERLEALGGAARDRILARAVAAADADETHALRQLIAEQERAIELLRGALAEG
jgi:hypothetical protein